MPDHNLFGQIRLKMNTNKLSKLFSIMRKQLRKAGYVSEVFTFIDISHLITKANPWKERNEAIKKKYEKLNNEVLPKVANDKQARIDCKDKDNF